MSDKLTAADALRKWQKQCDPEGIEVQVSRQALDEVLDALEAMQKENERYDQDVKMLNALCEGYERRIAELEAELEVWIALAKDYEKNIEALEKQALKGDNDE